MREVPKKRFSPSGEPFAVERRKGLREVVKQFQTEHSEVLGLTLYGSIIKTRSAEEALRLRDSADKARHRPDSDIDGSLIVDAKEVERITGDPNVVEFDIGSHKGKCILEGVQYLGTSIVLLKRTDAPIAYMSQQRSLLKAP